MIKNTDGNLITNFSQLRKVNFPSLNNLIICTRGIRKVITEWARIFKKYTKFIALISLLFGTETWTVVRDNGLGQ